MKDNKEATLALGTQPVGKLLWQYALPGVIAMTASSLYNMVDSIFIGHGVGPMALAALGISFPLITLIGAFANLFSTTVTMVAIIAARGLLAERRAAFKPR